MSQTYQSFKSSLGKEGYDRLTQAAKRCHHAPGTTIFAEGEPGHSLLVIESGQVEISAISIAGRKVVFSHMGQGDLVGEVALLDQSTRSATAIALNDVTGFLVGFEDFKAFLIGHPEVHFTFTTELCVKLRNANRVLEDQTEKDGTGRLARCLIRLAEKFGTPDGDTTTIAMQLSQSDIGDLAGLTRSNVNRHLRNWASAGFVQFDNGSLTITNEDALSDIAAGDV